MADGFRCSLASLEADEPMLGSAPSERAWLLVEYAGPWGREAVEESRLPEPVKARLASLPDVRVQLIRRPGGGAGPGVRVFLARLGQTGGSRVSTRVLARVDDLLALDLVEDAWEPAPGPLFLVCTNGRRDLCCAEFGRPIAAALAGRWPEATWETNHLGGHRFSGTLLALPSALVLGRLDPQSALAACADVLEGEVPLDFLRGRAGLPGAVQVAEAHVRSAGGDDVSVTGQAEEVVDLVADGVPQRVVLRAVATPRRQSCGDDKVKPARHYEVVSHVSGHLTT